MKLANKIILSILALTFLAASAFANDDEALKYEKGERVHYAYSYNGITDLVGEIVTLRSNAQYIIKLDEDYNEKKYLVGVTEDYIYSVEKCSTKTDDGSRLCAGSVAISFTYANDVTVIAINNYNDTVLINYNGTLVIVNVGTLISVEDDI